MSIQKVLIIGGTKFIGKELASRYISEKVDVTLFSRSPSDLKGVKYINGDREKPEDLKMLSDSIKDTYFDAVYDMCAYSLNHAETLYQTLKGHTQRMIFFSTAAVYPKTGIFPLEETRALAAHPSFGDYGVNKAAIEDYYEKVAINDGFQLTIFRPHYIFGSEDYFQRHQYLFYRLEQKAPIYIPGNGQALIQMAWHKDVVDLFHDVPMRQSSQVDTINIAGNEIITLDGLVEEFARAIGLTPKIQHVRYEDYNLNEKRFYDNLFIFPNLNIIIDNTKSKSIYSHSPTPISDAMPLLLKDWHSNKYNYEPNKDAEMLFGSK